MDLTLNCYPPVLLGMYQHSGAADRGLLFSMYIESVHQNRSYITLDGKVTSIVIGLGGLSLGRPYNAADFTVSNNANFAYTLGGTEHCFRFVAGR
jgi:acylaminoacyl-peptidase